MTISLLKIVALTKQLGDQHSTTQPGTVQATGRRKLPGFDTDAGIKAIPGFCKTQPPQWSIVIVGTTTTATTK